MKFTEQCHSVSTSSDSVSMTIIEVPWPALLKCDVDEQDSN